ncbi:regulatory protein RecX [Geobacter argillaceus]|uniref:Regulatory protein RecX n=1 Tax=Geobacter argillaceus TaxID=345631 RepID=A0A562VNB4_9BACT|nr:regulatory protein RecX [Geobacter argillaceus]TWJ19483.1 regulatory protein [Geobacter argillaceus]
MAGTAMDAALNLLARRDHSSAELSRKLAAKGFPADEIEATLSRLHGLAYLDDRRYAEQWAARAVREGTAVGPRLRLELRRRGIPPEIVEAAMAAAGEELDERQAIGELLARRFTGFDPATATPRETRRLVNWFQRRGFSLSAIFDTLRMAGDE